MALPCLVMKSLFLMVLGSGTKVSEILAMSRHRNLLEFEDKVLLVKINPNPRFIV